MNKQLSAVFSQDDNPAVIDVNENHRRKMGDDKDIKVIEISDDWIMPEPDKTKKDPAFDKSDNPGV